MRYAFRDYILDTKCYELRKAGRLVELKPQLLKLLTYLIEHRDRLVRKNELITHLWGTEKFVQDAALTTSIYELRQALGDNARRPEYIKTRSGLGYQFVGPVEQAQQDDTQIESKEHFEGVIKEKEVTQPTTERIAAANLILQFNNQIQQYNDVHLCLIATGWRDGAKNPELPEEWNRVQRYMGALETLWQLVEDGIYPIERVDHDYSHRVLAMITNLVIHETCIVEKRFAWSQFINLWRCLESRQVYRGLAEEYRKKGVSVPSALS